MQEFCHMSKVTISVSAAALLLGSVALSMAADSDRGKSESAPGQQMLESQGKGGPGGASRFAPGHDRDDLGKGTLRDHDDRGTMMDRDRK
jgi:Spy/CpxP family protein refolding chaperone